MAKEERLIVGLGNPGEKYAKTRHNLGFLILERFAKTHGFIFKKESRFDGALAQGDYSGLSVRLLMPLTYMNLSGVAVRKACDYYKVDASRVLVVCDDAALSFGKLRLRSEGSFGGHRGLESIEEHLGTFRYPRLKAGIGEGRIPLEAHVLERFSDEEMAQLDSFLDKGAKALEIWLAEPLITAMNKVNAPQEAKEERNISKNPPEGVEEKEHGKR